MFWIIFMILCFVFATPIFIIDRKKGWKTSYSMWGIVPGVLLLFLTLIALGCNMGVYQQLIESRETALSVKAEISNIRNAYYKESNSSNATLINGSLDNMKQSTILSEYISNYAKVKALYNGKLKSTKASKTFLIYKLFSYSIFIPNEVMRLETIE